VSVSGFFPCLITLASKQVIKFATDTEQSAPRSPGATREQSLPRVSAKASAGSSK
jgi:hypothetical protein